MKGTFSLFRHLLLFFHWLFLSLSLLLFLFKFFFCIWFLRRLMQKISDREKAQRIVVLSIIEYFLLSAIIFFLGFCVARNFPPLAVCNKCRLLI